MTNFDRFTNLYELSKTLRFELRPIGNTSKMLENNGVFEEDKLRKEKYEKVKEYFDRFHREFVCEALHNKILVGLENYLEKLKLFYSDNKNKSKKKYLEDIEQKLRKEVVVFFDEKAEEISNQYSSLKKKNIEIFFEEGVFQLLKDRYDNDETKIVDEKTGDKTSIFDGFNGFTGYFKKFYESRKNFYKYDGTSTALATRIVDQNLRRFCDNLIIFDNVVNKLDLSEIERSFLKSMSEVFSLNFYNTCLLQDGIDFYNKVLGGETLKDGTKLRGVNELINEYRQKNKGDKLPFLKLLDKQILSEKDEKIFVIKNDDEFKKILSVFLKNVSDKIINLKQLIKVFVANEFQEDLSGIYISKAAFNTISNKWTDKTRDFEALLYDVLKVDKLAKYEKNNDSYKFPDFIALSYVKKSLENYVLDENFWKDRYYKIENNINGVLSGHESLWLQFLMIFEIEFNSLFSKKNIDNKTGKDVVVGYDLSRKNLLDFLKEDNFVINDKSKILIKNFADNVLCIYQMGKYFSLEKKRKWNSENLILGDFYDNSEFGYFKYYVGTYEQIVQKYNDIRNYLTKKPWESVKKWKLNFENSTLGDGWDKNKESDNYCLVFKKNKQYFLGIMKKGNTGLFLDKKSKEFEFFGNDNYQKLVYKYFPDAAKMIPKCSTQLKDIKEHFKNSLSDFKLFTKNFKEPLFVSKRVFDLNNIQYDKSDILNIISDNGVKLFQKDYLRISGDFKKYKSALNDWIDFCKNFLHKYESTKHFDFNFFKKTDEYNSLDEFYNDIDKLSYKIDFINVSESYISQKNKNGELYLFEIYNQDFAEGKTGLKNLHTMYFEGLFSEDNFHQNFPLKLNGGAEIFFRPKSIEEKKVKRNFSRDVIENKRYTKDKMFLHFPIALNRGKGKSISFNTNVNNFLSNNSNINILGIDRGEKHLAYYSVLDQNGSILDHGSLNIINKIDYVNNKVSTVNYADKLEVKSKNRDDNRKDWQTIEGIKDLKMGYISQVVHKLADLVIKYNAIIVFEDLNMRFKQIRGGIEKSIYQQLEKALIGKLNFLVNKGEVDVNKAGNLLKAYQLTAPFESFKDMGKQTGILFYTQASYTSKIDPVTGWRPNLYFKSGNAELNKENILKFSDISFNSAKKRFEFIYDLKNFLKNKDQKFPLKTKWTLCSCVERWMWNSHLNQNKGGYDYYSNLTDYFSDLFESVNIDFLNGDILTQIKNLSIKGNEKFFGKFIFLWKLLSQIRNTDNKLDEKIKDLEKNGQRDKITDEEKNNVDIILSPVEPFFDSRKSQSFGTNLPVNGDDNGAFNIARKGIILLSKLSIWKNENEILLKDGKKEKVYPDLFVSNIEWDDFVTN